MKIIRRTPKKFKLNLRHLPKWAIPVIIVAVLLLGTGIALAVAGLNQNYSYTVTASPAIEQSLDGTSYTTTNAPIAFGNIGQGTSITKYLWIKNVGSQPVDLTVTPVNLPESGTGVTFFWEVDPTSTYGVTNVPSNGITKLMLTLSASPTATLTSGSFNSSVSAQLTA